MAADADVPPEVLAVLPPDAPPGHRAHTAVKFVQLNDGRAQRWVVDSAGSGVPFRVQTTAAPAGGYAEAARRIARSMCVLMDEGMDKNSCLEWRRQCYERVQEAIGAAPRMTRRWKAAVLAPAAEATPAPAPAAAAEPAAPVAPPPAEALPAPEAKAPATSRGRKSRGPASLPAPAPAADAASAPARAGEAEGGPAAVPPAPGCAIEGGAAFAEREAEVLRLLGEPPAGRPDSLGHRPSQALVFVDEPGPPRFRYQVTYNACGNSTAVAERVLLLCYSRHVAGDTREQVTERRKGWYEMVQAHLGKAQPFKRKATNAVEESAEPAKPPRRPKRSKLDVAAEAPVPAADVPAPAADVPAPAAAPSAHAPPAAEALKTQAVPGSSTEGAPSAVCPRPAGEAPFLQGQVGGAADAVADDDSSLPPPDSSSSSSSSSEDELAPAPAVVAVGVAGSAAASAPAGANVNGADAPVAQAPQPSPDEHLVPLRAHASAVPRPGKVCGKMLVRAGLRCPCHFALAADCENRTVSMSD